MSVKIYEAYRIREGADPWETLWWIQSTARDLARSRLREIFEQVLDGRSEREQQRVKSIDEQFDAWRREHHPGEHVPHQVMKLLSMWMRIHDQPREPIAKLAVTRAQILAELEEDDSDAMFPVHLERWIYGKYAGQVADSRRNEWDLSSSVTVRVHNQRFYLIPYCERISLLGNVFESLKSEPRLEDFCYFDNVDPPEDVKAEWPHREQIWDHLRERWDQHLVLDVLSVSNWDDVVPYDLFRSTLRFKADTFGEEKP